MNHSKRAARALAQLAEVDPALAVLALWCTHRDGDGVTITRGDTIIYGPSFTDLGLAEQVGLAAHHVLHVALRHSGRQVALAERLGPGFDPVLHGVACDAIVNETLQMAGHALPRPAILLTDLLTRLGQQAVSPIAALTEWDSDRLTMYLHSDGKRAARAREVADDHAFEQDVASAQGDRTDAQPGTADWRNHMVRALEAGRRAGSGIGRMGGFLADLALPRVPWEVELRGALTRAVSDHALPTYRRPAARWVAQSADARARGAPEPVFQPGLARDGKRPRIVVGLDTSSSIDPTVMALFLTEAKGVSRRTGAETHLISFDEQVQFVRRVDGRDQGLTGADLRTGGGTDFQPMLAEAKRLDPSILVVLTDLDAPFGPPPPMPVLWAVPGPPDGLDPPFGRVLRIGA